MKTPFHPNRQWYLEKPETVRAFLKRRSIKGKNGCRLWVGAHDGHGYGNIRQGNLNYRAHRLAMMAEAGRFLPRQIEVCHKCDTPLCINIKHLFLGTHKENYLDLAKKGLVPGAILTAKKVKRIRMLLALGVTRTEVAKIYEVSQGAIGCLVSGRTWAHVK